MQNFSKVLTVTQYIEYRKNNPSKFEDNNEPSETLQGQAMPMSEIVQRFTLGQSLNLGNNIYFDGDNPTFEDVDITLNRDFDLADYDNEKSKLEAFAAKKTSKREDESKKTERSGVSKSNPELTSSSNDVNTDNKLTIPLPLSPPPPQT